MHGISFDIGSGGEIDCGGMKNETGMVTVDEDGSEVVDPIRASDYLQEGFRDAYFRSQEVRGQLWSLVPLAMRKVREVLELETENEKTVSTQYKAAQFVLDANLVKFPDVSHRSVSISDGRVPKGMREFQPVTKAEVIEAAVIAIKAEGHRGGSGEEGGSGGAGGDDGSESE